jgi:class 3 adenylate cyclase/tetratricopeptide (TPR) repeat protein
VDSLFAWLQEHGLERYAPVLTDNDVDLEALRLLTEADFERLGVSLGHRRKLLKAIAELNGSLTPAPAVQPNQESPRPHESISSQAERRQLTVMFCDLVGSTALAERLDPEELRTLMQAYRNACGEVVARYEGHVAQYLGDGLMVYFGWPRAHEDDAERSVRSALEMVQAVKGVRAMQPLAVRIGVATGAVVVGEASREDNAEAKLAVGETPNLAARLQGLAGPDEIVLAPATRRLVGDIFELSDLGSRPLKGIAEPVRAWRVEAVRRTEGRFDAARGIALTPLVGREEEVALLLRRWQQAREGEGQVVLVSGEPGIGKSRLTQVLREQIEAQPHAALCYQCSPYHLNAALYPVIKQFEFAAGFSREETAAQKLDKMEALLVGNQKQRAECAPLVAALLSLPNERYQPLQLSPQKQKEKTLEVLAEQVEALARHQPVLIVFEDVHWIDPTSEELVGVFVRGLYALPILLVMTYRPEHTPAWVGQHNVTSLTLNRLGPRQGAELVAKVTGGKALPNEVLNQILAHTDGVPLFVEELTKSTLESGLLRELGDQYVLPAPLPALAIPMSLRDSLVARLDRLASIKEIAQIGACIGREFSYVLLAAVSPLSGDHLEKALTTLVDAGLVFRRGTPPDTTYTFKHALVQDAAYDSLLKSKRLQLHARIAQALENDFSDLVVNEPELLAYHYTQAGNLDAAIPHWRKAGELDLKRVALQEAIGHLNLGLELCMTLPPSADRDAQELSLRSLLLTAWPALKGWATPEVREQAEFVVRLSGALGNSDALLRGLYGLFVNTIGQGRVAESLDWVDRLQTHAQTTNSVEFAICAEVAATTALHFAGEFSRAREHRARVLTLYDETLSERLEQIVQILGVDARTAMGVHGSVFVWVLGYADQAVKIADETIAHARVQRQPFNLSWALAVGALVFCHRCEPDRLLELAKEAERLGREHAMWYVVEVISSWSKGLALLRAGQTVEAIGLLHVLLARKIQTNSLILIPFLKSALAEGLTLQGNYEGALQLIDEALEQAERPGWQERAHLAEILRLKGWMLMRQGRGEEAEVQLRASIDLARQQQAKSWELRGSITLAKLLTERGQRDAARELLAAIYNWFTEGFDTKDLKEAKALLGELG